MIVSKKENRVNEADNKCPKKVLKKLGNSPYVQRNWALKGPMGLAEIRTSHCKKKKNIYTITNS